MHQKTAAVLHISSEVTQNNDLLWYAAKQLKAFNFQVEKVAVVSCKEALLAFELESSVKQCDVVVLLGGLEGPNAQTACRVTCKVFHQKAVFNEQLAQQLSSGCDGIPMHAKVLQKGCPVVYVQGLLLTTEDPQRFRASFAEIVGPFLENLSQKPQLKKSFLLPKEDAEKLPRRENVDVSVGEGAVSKVVISSSSMNSLFGYEQNVKEMFGSRPSFLRGSENFSISETVYEQGQSHVRGSIECIEDCFSRYGPENVFISFNGGKDCTVLLHLTLGVLKMNYPEHTDKPVCVYIENYEPFPELNAFITLCEWYYDLEILKLKKNIKDGLKYVLEQKPNMKACLMGTRRTDPFSENLQSFQMTDPDWPQVMRVNPLLDWHYSEIWDYLLDLKVPYCSLYDAGYTSLGSMTNSSRNPALVMNDPMRGSHTYLPAYKLMDASLERHGRKS